MKLLITLVTYFLCFIPTLVILPLFPYLTRKTQSFGVSIPEELFDNKEIKGLRDRYRNNVLVWMIILDLAVVISLFVLPSETSFTVMIAGTFIQLIPVNIFYILSHLKMKALKSKSNWAIQKSQMVVIDTSFRNKKTLMSPMWFILYVAITAATLAIGLAVYDKLPDKIPMHYNVQGEVDRWADKSYGLLFTIPVIQTIIGILMAFVYFMIKKSKQQVDASEPEKSIVQNRTFRYRWSGYAIFTGAAMQLMFFLIQLSILDLIRPQVIIPVSLLIPAAIIGATIFLSLTTGQSGSRVLITYTMDKEGKYDKIISRDDDKYWKLGTFYFNPDDPTIFVEKRFGIGWDFNWARPISWIIMLGLLSLPLLILAVTRLLEK